MLLEREHTLAVLATAVADAAAGNGSVVLVTGEAGIGKTTPGPRVRPRRRRARILMSACDDLMASRALGPLRDAVLGPGPVDDIFSALLDELACRDADGARRRRHPLGRRRHARRARLRRATDRGDRRRARPHVPRRRGRGPPSAQPLPRRRSRAARSTAWRSRRCRRAAVRQLCEGTGADPARVHRVTRGNPFFVTEALASPADDVPVSVIEAVLARVGRLGPECRDALDQLSVVPSHVEMALAMGLLGRSLHALAEAEQAGVLEVSADRLAFRHELARRAIEQSLPALRRQQLNAAVVRELRAQHGAEPARVMHHAVEAGDVDTILAVGPDAWLEAARAGAHRQALAHITSVLPYVSALPARERAAVLDAYGWELYNAHRFREAVDAGREAARLYAETGRSRRRRAVPRARLAPPVHGRQDRRGGGGRRASGPAARADRRRAGARARLAVRRRDPRDDRRPRSCRADARARVRARPAHGPARPCRARAQLPRDRARRARQPGRARPAAREHRRGDRRPAVRVRGARLLQPRRAARPRRPSRRGRVVGRGRAALHARARVLVARLQPRGPPLRRADPPRPLGCRTERRCPSSSSGSTTRACCTSTACRGSAACWPGAATPRPSGCSRPRGSAPARSV